MPANITENVLEENICRALSLTRVNVLLNYLHTSHRMERSDIVIVKFKCEKQKNFFMYKRKNLGNQSQLLTNLTTYFDAKLTTQLVSLKFNGRQHLTEYF